MSVPWWYSWEPCEKLKRATDIPARSRSSMMESPALFGPSVHTICAGQRDAIISETREESSGRIAGRRGGRGAHLGLALHRGCPREDIVHLDVRHGDSKQATEGCCCSLGESLRARDN